MTKRAAAPYRPHIGVFLHGVAVGLIVGALLAVGLVAAGMVAAKGAAESGY